MKIKCHNQTCQHIWEYSGKLPYTDCPICMSTVPISKQLIGEYAENISIDIGKLNSQSRCEYIANKKSFKIMVT